MRTLKSVEQEEREEEHEEYEEEEEEQKEEEEGLAHDRVAAMFVQGLKALLGDDVQQQPEVAIAHSHPKMSFRRMWDTRRDPSLTYTGMRAQAMRVAGRRARHAKAPGLLPEPAQPGSGSWRCPKQTRCTGPSAAPPDGICAPSPRARWACRRTRRVRTSAGPAAGDYFAHVPSPSPCRCVYL